MRDKTIFSIVMAAVIAVAAAVPLSVAAYDFVEDGIYYNFNENRTEVAVTYKASKTASYSGEVAIPERVVHNGVTYPVTAIAGGAFSYSNNLTAVEIPNTVRSIGDHAFASCTALQGIVIPNSVESLGRCVFHTCSAMTSAVVGNSVPVIDEYCFQYCYSLNDVVIGTSVEFLAIKAFFDCPNIRKVTCLATTPPSMNASYSLSNEAYQNATLCVPGSAMAAYKADTNWGRFRTFVNITMATSLTLDCTSLSLKSGAQHQFVASVMPADASPAVRWSTSDNEVAVVDQNGMVTAMGAGQATITATTLDGTDISASCMVHVISMGMQTDNVLTLPESMQVQSGKDFELPVMMENDASITALQCDITLPEGFELVQDNGNYMIDLAADRVGGSHVLTCRPLQDGGVRVLITSPIAEPITGNEGTLFTLHLNVGDVVPDGSYPVQMDNIVLASVNAQTFYAPETFTTVTVKSYIKGDANGDDVVNVGDYVATANYILMMNPDPFIFDAADVDENKTIDVGDLVGIANIVLGDFAMPENATSHPANDVQFTGECAVTDNTMTVTLDLSNAMVLTACQMDVNLPEGLTLEQAYLTSRAATHSLAVNELENGSLRLLASSSVNDELTGHEGAVLTLVLSGMTVDDALIGFDNILLAERDMTTHAAQSFAVSVENSSVRDLRGNVRIYASGRDIIVETPVDTQVEFILPNGMTRTAKATAGTNVYPADRGILIVRAAGQVAKLKL